MKIWRLKKAIFIYHLFLAYLNSFPGPLLTKHEDPNIEYRMLPSPMNTISIKTVFYGFPVFTKLDMPVNAPVSHMPLKHQMVFPRVPSLIIQIQIFFSFII